MLGRDESAAGNVDRDVASRTLRFGAHGNPQSHREAVKHISHASPSQRSFSAWICPGSSVRLIYGWGGVVLFMVRTRRIRECVYLVRK